MKTRIYAAPAVKGLITLDYIFQLYTSFFERRGQIIDYKSHPGKLIILIVFLKRHR